MKIDIKSHCILLVFYLVSVMLFSGCTMNNPMIDDIETAYNLPAKSHKERNSNITNKIREKLPPGTKINEALKMFDKHGFEIIHNEKDGWKYWPDGNKTEYNDLQKRIRAGASNNHDWYVIKKSYFTHPLERKRVVISIEYDGANIITVRANLYSDTL